MGSIYQRKWKDKNGNVRESDVHWIKYYRDGRPMRESSESTKESDARKLLKLREGDVVRGVPITPKVTRVRFRELAEDVVTDYKVNGRRSIGDLEMRLRRHILPYFGQRRAASITTADINKFILQRQQSGASNGEINRELSHVKRAFSLGVQSGKILQRPHIPMLRENNVRRGFFEREQFEEVRGHLPQTLRGGVTFMYVTGWRSRSEVLALEWPQVNFKAGTVSLDAGQTKNEEARTFPMTDELRAALEKQRAYTDRVQRKLGAIIPHVFHREGKPIRGFRKAWARACHEAGLPCQVETETGPDGKVRVKSIKAASLLHDFRRTAVRNLVRAAVPERVAMQLTGHKTRSVFERYNIVSPGDLMEAANKLNQFHGGHNEKPLSFASSSTGTNAGTMKVSATGAKR